MASALYKLLARALFRYANINQMVDRRDTVLYIQRPTLTQ